MKQEKIYLFDFDGVIIDSYEVCLSVTRLYDFDIDEETYKNMFKGNIYNSLNERIVEVPDDFDFSANYTPRISNLAPIKGIEEVLKNCAEEGLIYIVSSTYSLPIKEYLTKLKLNRYISDIYGGDVEKSKTKKLSNILAANPNHRVFFVTDTLGDIIESEKLNITTIGVTWGFHDRQTLEEGKPDFIVHTTTELDSILQSQ